MLVPEVVEGGAGGQHERVVRDAVAVGKSQSVEVGPDIAHLAEQDASVALFAQQGAQRSRDIGR